MSTEAWQMKAMMAGLDRIFSQKPKMPVAAFKAAIEEHGEWWKLRDAWEKQDAIELLRLLNETVRFDRELRK